MRLTDSDHLRNLLAEYCACIDHGATAVADHRITPAASDGPDGPVEEPSAPA